MGLLSKSSGRWKAYALAVAFALACCGQAAAPPKAHFSVEVLDWRKGLPESVVFTITQTRDGYLWAGTLEGLARFDGLRFTTFDEANTPELNSSRIIKVFEDSRTNLWLGTESAGVFLARTGQVARVALADAGAEGRVTGICEDSTGAVWLYTSEGWLTRYGDGKVARWQVQPGAPSKCRAIIADNSGFVWVGTDSWLYGLRPEEAVGSPDALPPYTKVPYFKLDFLVPGSNGGHWRLANGRIQRFRGNIPQSGSEPLLYPWPTNIAVTAACEDHQGNLIVGTYGDGVYWFDAQGQFAHISNELSQKSVLSLAVDREGGLWVGTNGRGLNRVRRQVFEVFGPSQDSTVQTVAEDESGSLWIGYNGERIDYWADGTLRQYTNLIDRAGLLLPPPLYVHSVFVDSAHQVWAGVLNGGLLELTNGRFSPVSNPYRFTGDLSVLYEDRNHVLWIGTDEGLAVKSGAGWVLTNAVPPAPVRAIAEDGEGSLWVGTEGAGLACVSRAGTRVYTRTNGLPSNNVRSLYCDKEGVLWVGTSSGLARFAQNQWVAYTGRLGQARGGIGYLLEDNRGYLWMGTTAGLLRASKQDLNTLANNGESLLLRSFGESDGLPAAECSQGSQPSALQDHMGKLWFPTISGLVSVDPQLIQANSNPPPVIIEAVLIDGRSQHSNRLRAPFPEKITVPAGRESVEIQYTSLSFSAPEKGFFKYILHGYEKGWTERPAQIRSARYSRLPHGNYEFQVIACNEDGIWNKTGARLAITILPPFWQTWWFVSITSVFLLSIIVASVSYISTQRLQQQVAALRQKEALEAERARIARDLHDQLGANLTQVALLGEMAEQDKNAPEEVESHARQISQTARETTHALDEIVWTVNPSNDTLDGLVNYVCKYAQDYFAMAGLKYRLEVPPQLPNTPISPELRHNVFLAAKEAINNVVKHARASSAYLRLTLNPDRFVLEIEDDGKGVAAADHKKGRSGLRNMRKRMQDIGGEFEITPAAGQGSCVRLTAPLRAPGAASAI